MEHDGKYMMENNYRYTLELYRWAQELGIPFIYASSAATYGAHQEFIEDVRYEGPLTSTATPSTSLTRCFAENSRAFALRDRLRYFTSTARTSSTRAAWPPSPSTSTSTYRRHGQGKLFEGCLGYGNGEQSRDFVYVATSARCLCTSSTSPSPASTTAARAEPSRSTTSPCP